MTEYEVNRLSVVKHDVLVGIVTRTDLVRAFIRSDEEIERELRGEVLDRTMWLDRDCVELDVKRGVVNLAGTLRTRSEVALLEAMTARIPGVAAVTSDTTWNVDDTSRKESTQPGARSGDMHDCATRETPAVNPSGFYRAASESSLMARQCAQANL